VQIELTLAAGEHFTKLYITQFAIIIIIFNVLFLFLTTATTAVIAVVL
jgi:hypothetical protein